MPVPWNHTVETVEQWLVMSSCIMMMTAMAQTCSTLHTHQRTTEVDLGMFSQAGTRIQRRPNMGPPFLTTSLTVKYSDPNLNPNRRLRLTPSPNPKPSQHTLYPARFPVSRVPEHCRKAGLKIYQGGFYRLAVARVCLHVDNDNLVCKGSWATG